MLWFVNASVARCEYVSDSGNHDPGSRPRYEGSNRCSSSSEDEIAQRKFIWRSIGDSVSKN